METELKIRALKSALNLAGTKIHEFRHNTQTVAEVQEATREFNELKNSRDNFQEGDEVLILKDYIAGGRVLYKKGSHQIVECCGEEVGGVENIKLIKPRKE